MAAKEDAQEALFTAITTTVNSLEREGYPAVQAAPAIESLALAYRYLAGGTQPGSSVVAK